VIRHYFVYITINFIHITLLLSILYNINIHLLDNDGSHFIGDNNNTKVGYLVFLYICGMHTLYCYNDLNDCGYDVGNHNTITIVR